MVVEDSAVARDLITDVLNGDPRLKVICAVDTAEKAVRLVPRLAPDVISMDLRLPGMSGIEATRRIMAECPTPVVVVAADLDGNTVNNSMEALAAGALSVVEKPRIESQEAYRAMARRLCDHQGRSLAGTGGAPAASPRPTPYPWSKECAMTHARSLTQPRRLVVSLLGLLALAAVAPIEVAAQTESASPPPGEAPSAKVAVSPLCEAENAPLVTVVDFTALEIEFQVAESSANEIRPGMSAEVTLDGRKLIGEVAGISPDVRNSQVTGRVRFAEQPRGLRQNQRASVRIVLDERSEVTKVARSAFHDTDTRFVYVVRDDEAVRTPVEFGAAAIGEIEVRNGLEVGDVVVLSDMREFKDAPAVLIAN